MRRERPHLRTGQALQASKGSQAGEDAVNPHPIEKWYIGKALARLQKFVLPTLFEAQQLGYWPKGMSRTIKAALNKQRVAEKLGRENEGRLRNFDRDDDNDRASGFRVMMALAYGQVESAPTVIELTKKLMRLCRDDEDRGLIAQAARWAQDFQPVAELIALLDATRVPPTIVMGTLSPSVVANLGKALEINFATIRYPEFKREWVWMDVPISGGKGKTQRVRVPVIEIIWPEGTRHCCSRFSFGSRAGNDQCQACGHAIKDPWNWVPLLADGPQGPMSLWVGRNCAGKLFGVKIDGKAQYKGRIEAAP
jgi:hypothetical protein